MSFPSLILTLLPFLRKGRDAFSNAGMGEVLNSGETAGAVQQIRFFAFAQNDKKQAQYGKERAQDGIGRPRTTKGGLSMA